MNKFEEMMNGSIKNPTSEQIQEALNGLKPDEAVENILNMFSRTANNAEFVQMMKKQRLM